MLKNNLKEHKSKYSKKEDWMVQVSSLEKYRKKYNQHSINGLETDDEEFKKQPYLDGLKTPILINRMKSQKRRNQTNIAYFNNQKKFNLSEEEADQTKAKEKATEQQKRGQVPLQERKKKRIRFSDFTQSKRNMYENHRISNQNRRKFTNDETKCQFMSISPPKERKIKTIKIVDVNDESYKFIQSLSYNEVFFCANCYRYVFAVEKSYHYPVCRNDAKIENNYEYGIGRLKMLEELAVYTNTKCHIIKERIKLIEEKKYIQENNFIKPVKYLKLNEIDWALDIIYSNLMKFEGEEGVICGGILTNSLNEL